MQYHGIFDCYMKP